MSDEAKRLMNRVVNRSMKEKRKRKSLLLHLDELKKWECIMYHILGDAGYIESRTRNLAEKHDLPEGV